MQKWAIVFESLIRITFARLPHWHLKNSGSGINIIRMVVIGRTSFYLKLKTFQPSRGCRRVEQVLTDGFVTFKTSYGEVIEQGA